MSSSVGGDSKFPTPKPPQSGIKTVLQYTGIPPSWLDKRPGLPSRNWLIFLGVTSTILGCYYYDRQESKRIRQEYVDKVKHLAEVPIHSLANPRKVTVYGSKWPDDDEYDRSLKYFRKYVKPIFVAAAVDYDMITGRRHGDLAERIAEDIKARRRMEAGLDPPPPNPMNLPTLSIQDIRRRELEGGVVIVGRPTFKEYMAGLKRGWSESLVKVDKEEKLAMELESDGRFDEPPEPDTVPVELGDLDEEPVPTASKLPPSKGFSPFTPPHLRGDQQGPRTSSFPSSQKVDPAATVPPPAFLPPHPPLLLVEFHNRIGFSQMPMMVWDFFNERHRVRAGAEAAYKLIKNETRPFIAPPPSLNSTDDFTDSPPQPYLTEIPGEPTSIPTDLDFGKESEALYKSSAVKSFVSNIEKARTGYYKELPTKLETARAIARGTREPTKDENNYPPPTEVQLRAERLKKEMRWRNDVAGWEIIAPEKDVEWDERFRGVLKVFVTPSEEEVEKPSS
ncbi:inner membrane protein import complex subunit Tim54-domain-containing protein [Cristinia sonorae]|uniref:Mitochondrial import inner membrane translocase subunit TIM54 n=1 Tax=Cristinia sonorae TaxID=1940300 RepID=A0A8K0UNU7_9AGAR|nr:inner membrane protein import complex subunit Tim54-domain-containing protein [Cristinia sonorae]